MIFLRNPYIKYDLFSMPDGAPHCRINHMPPINYIEYVARITDFNDLGLLNALKDAIDHTTQVFSTLHLLYLPCRQDRREPNNSFDLKLYTDIIDSMCFDKISILHPHSNVVLSLLDSVNPVFAVYPNDFWTAVIKASKPDAIVIPDAGAEKLIEKLPIIGIEKIQCLKNRDSNTGKLSAPRIFGEIDNKKLLIVDDICDGGGTFIQLADTMKNNNVKIDLCITHGLFTKGYKELNKRFETIYTTNSYRDKPDFDITISNDCYKVHMYNLETGAFHVN